MKIALIQIPSVIGDVKANIAKIEKCMGETDAELLIFPEMFLTGYNIGDMLFTLALDVEGDEMEKLSSLCRSNKRSIIFGMPRKDDVIRGEVLNSSVAIGADGEVTFYDKWHLPNFGPFDERRYFRQGHHLAVFEINGIKLGLIICYDIFFPELTKQYALMGCDGVVCISAAPSITLRFFEAIVPARAIENTIFMIYSNVIGNEKNLIFKGGAQVWGPRGDRKVRAEDFKECIIELDLDMAEVETARRLRPVLKDTRIEGLFSND
ncbi:MAG: carbon-nitrogen hydrolase family protein [Candidatus Thermoplasmatota archaeon]|jgi:predicted amidohydrolase|nr:carbon-nitrogen hydrolase family protein [Candidatus Thermoplasmatota archaeon]MDP7264096.1 carbon-nitrogen hydrolase family protein [Candidatus Thermoplasmatota archaeon]